MKATIASEEPQADPLASDQNFHELTQLNRWRRVRGFAALGFLVGAAIAGYLLVLIALSVFSPERATVFL